MNRFEGYVSSVEGPSTANLDRLESLISRLEKLQKSGAPVPAVLLAEVKQIATSGGASFVSKFKESCFKNVDHLLAITKEQGNEHLMTGVMHYMDMLNS